ncbi:MAG: hypothetical protein JNJ48_07525 [Phycisphaerae bacterium]|nr:hypothetical protein [Phycisphaerae bacterium]
MAIRVRSGVPVLAGVLLFVGAAAGQTVTGDFGNSFAGGAYNAGGNTYNGLILFGLPLGGGGFQGGSTAQMVRSPAAGPQFDTFRVNSTLWGGSDPTGVFTSTQYGNFRFTASNSFTTYSITGTTGFQIAGNTFSGVSVNVSLVEVVSGNVLAWWSSGGAGFNFSGTLFDTVNPAQIGSWNGLLSAGVQYDFLWSYQINVGADAVNASTVQLTPSPGYNTTWLQIQFAPSPGATAVLGLGGLAAMRRRR